MSLHVFHVRMNEKEVVAVLAVRAHCSLFSARQFPDGTCCPQDPAADSQQHTFIYAGLVPLPATASTEETRYRNTVSHSYGDSRIDKETCFDGALEWCVYYPCWQGNLQAPPPQLPVRRRVENPVRSEYFIS